MAYVKPVTSTSYSPFHEQRGVADRLRDVAAVAAVVLLLAVLPLGGIEPERYRLPSAGGSRRDARALGSHRAIAPSGRDSAGRMQLRMPTGGGMRPP
eukprot:3216753-Prymnesium_polylepis.3